MTDAHSHLDSCITEVWDLLERIGHETTDSHRFVLRSFNARFEPFAQGAGSPGQAFVSLPAEARHAVREEVRRDLGDTGGAIEVEYRFGSATAAPAAPASENEKRGGAVADTVAFPC